MSRDENAIGRVVQRSRILTNLCWIKGYFGVQKWMLLFLYSVDIFNVKFGDLNQRFVYIEHVFFCKDL